ncbi:hypothetical protein [Kibdelosporangium philippinense]|uniref:hypothetical protein n=1 Tax=Kibdelosporangium philippinense TaxID=211113 RepID=UPI0036164764
MGTITGIAGSPPIASASGYSSASGCVGRRLVAGNMSSTVKVTMKANVFTQTCGSTLYSL